MSNSKRNLEINPGHPVIKELLQRVQSGADKETEEMATLLYEAALLHSGLIDLVLHIKIENRICTC